MTEPEFLINKKTGMVIPPNRLSVVEFAALEEWLPWKGKLDDNLLAQAGYQLNLERHAKSHGPRLVSYLVQIGILEPEQDPLNALKIFIETHERGSC